MNMKLLFALLLLPGLAHAVVCKTVGPDGVASFTDVPAAECPQGSRTPDYSRPAPVAEQAGSVDTGVSARQVKFAGYESIEIVSPEADGTVQHNSGNIQVSVKLDPGLQQSHFMTAYLDGKAFRGRYGSSQITLTGVDRGTHKLYVKVSDTKGKTLIKSDTISFTVRQVPPKLIVNPITGDDYVDNYDPRWVKILGCYECTDSKRYEDRDNKRDKRRRVKLIPSAWVSLWFPARGWESRPVGVFPEAKTVEYMINTKDGPKTVVETFNWVVRVPRDFLATEASFEARVRIYTTEEYPAAAPLPGEVPLKEFKTTSTHSVDPSLFKAFYNPAPNADYGSEFGGISTTPGETNPAFPGVSTTPPGQTNPAFKPKYTP